MLGYLYAVPLNMQNLIVQPLDEVRLLEWGGVVKELMSADFAIGFMLDHTRHLAHIMFG